MSDVEDLIGDPLTIEEIIEAEAERDMDIYVQNDDEDNEENNENAIPQLPTQPQGTAVDPKKKRVVKNRQTLLNPARLMGPRGIIVLEQAFKDFEFHGKGFEKVDLNNMMKKLEHWAHRLYPKFKFDDCIQKIETLGHKKEVKTYLKKIRMGIATAESVLEEEVPPEKEEEVYDEPPIDAFDELLSQQISQIQKTVPPVHSVAPSSAPNITLTAEQQERMIKNRLIAEQRRLERMKAQHDAAQTKMNNTSLDGGTVVTSSSSSDQLQTPSAGMNQSESPQLNCQTSEENLNTVVNRRHSGEKISVQVEVYSEPKEDRISISNTTTNNSTWGVKAFDEIQTDANSTPGTTTDSGAFEVIEEAPLSDQPNDAVNNIGDEM